MPFSVPCQQFLASYSTKNAVIGAAIKSASFNLHFAKTPTVDKNRTPHYILRIIPMHTIFAGRDAEARQYLKGAALKEFKWDVQDYIKYGQENAVSGAWTTALENASAKYHISKLEALKVQTQHSLEVMFAKQQGTVASTMRNVYNNGYYHTAYEIQNGLGIGFDISGLDQSQIEKIISKPWAVDGYNFSQRIWSSKNKLISTIHNELTQNIILGKDPQKAIDAIAKQMTTSKHNAGRLVMTEEAYFSSAAQKDCFSDLGVEEYEIVATLDSHTSEICQTMDGQHFPMKDYQAGVTAPPFHVYCRSTTAPYFDEQFDISERAARDENGKTYYVPDDMTYKDWEKTFVNGGDKSGLTENENGSIIKMSEGGDMLLEYQRYGRNKETTVNHTYINSGEYRNKFDKITNDVGINRILYTTAKEMLNHRSGTKYEDMYWVDGATGEIVASALNEQKESGIQYTDTILKAISGKSNLIAFHNHPSSLPPSAADFNSMLVHGYKTAFIVCHDGKIIQYVSHEEIRESLYNSYIQRYIADGCTEFEAQWKTLKKLKEGYDIDFWEVSP